MGQSHSLNKPFRRGRQSGPTAGETPGPQANDENPVDIPFDLQQMVLDELRDDKAALASCSLVCHSWLPTFQRLLFHTLPITPTREQSDLLLEDFLKLLSTKAVLASYVRRLEICGKKVLEGESLLSVESSPPHLAFFLSSYTPWQIHQSNLISILHTLPELEELYISYVEFPEATIMPMDPPAFRLVKLEVEHVRITPGPPQNLVWLFQLFGHISLLRVHDANFPYSTMLDSAVIQEGRIGGQVEHIDFSQLGPFILPWALNALCNSSIVPHLKSLRLDPLTGTPDWAALARVLRTDDVQLEDLSINSWTISRYRAPAVVSLVSVASCAGLKTFSAVVSYMNTEPTLEEDRELNHNAWMAYMETLQSLPTSLESVCFHINLREEKINWLEDTEAIDWESLKKAVERLEGLKSLRFVFKDETRSGEAPTQDCVRIVREALSDICERGILELEIVPKSVWEYYRR